MIIKNKFFRIKFPHKSLFGFKTLNSLHSVLSSYLFVAFYLFSLKFSSNTQKEIIALISYRIICILSFNILFLNSYIRRFEFKKPTFKKVKNLMLVISLGSIYLLFKNLLILKNTLDI